MNDQQPGSTSSSAPSSVWKKLIAVLAVVVVVALVTLFANKSKDETDQTQNDADQASTSDLSTDAEAVKQDQDTPAVKNNDTSSRQTDPTPSDTTAATYKDGTYTAQGTYQVPSGTETVGVSLTIENDVVTAVAIDEQGIHAVSQQMQAMFAAGIAAQVVGVKIDELNVGVVSGSSLTPIGFNDALVKIKAEAKA